MTPADSLRPAPQAGYTAPRQLALALAATVVVVVVGSEAPLLLPQSSLPEIESALTHGQAAIMFGAASLGLLSGRWVARTSVGFACSALLVLAFAGAISGTVGQTGFIPVLYTSGAALAVVLLLAAAAAPEVSDAASFRQLINRESGPTALLALVALTPVVDALLVAAMTMAGSTRIVFSALVAAGWLLAGIKVLRLNRPQLKWLPAVLVILAVEAVVRAFGGVVWSESLLIAIGLKALAGSFALLGAAMAARAALVSTTDGMTSMLQDLNDLQDEDSRRRAEDSERLHEVRSLLAGLHAATGSLRKYEGSITPDVRRRLEDAVGAELDRLNHLIDPRMPEIAMELDLEAVVMSVVVAEREQGMRITTDLANVSIQGSAADIATLVSDLLVNARVHAPGSAVGLTARVDGEMATLSVRDWGPGLSSIEATRVFERSYRGARTIATGVPGSGLGLHNARRLARQMQGELQVIAPEGGGCCFVATLPVTQKRDDQVIAALEADLATGASHTVHPSPRRRRWIHQRS